MDIKKNTGIILSENNYSYSGELLCNYKKRKKNHQSTEYDFLKIPVAHGLGRYEYANGDIYIGNSYYGKIDGFGKYIFKNKNVYIGFFSYGKIHGIGTYYDYINKTVSKGQWRNDKKHGEFIVSDMLNKSLMSFDKQILFDKQTPLNPRELTSKICLYIANELKTSEECEYISCNYLQTTKEGKTQSKFKKKQYMGKTKKCVCCEVDNCDSTNDKCGHVALCYNCLIKCDKCPICRVPIGKVIKLYVSVN